MKLPFFRKDENRDEKQGEADGRRGEIAPADAASIEVVSDAPLDLSLYERVDFDAGFPGDGTFLDRLVPLAGAAGDAAAQRGYAIVKFPPGVGWQDLANRKTPGWEDMKHVMTPKGAAAIKQAKLPPAAVANIALQGAAIIVGQAYMTEINQQLESIEAGIASIQQEMKMEREAKLGASFDMLREYAELYAEISQNPEKRQAVLVSIEGIRKDVREAWGFQLRAMAAMNKRLSTGKRMKDDDLRSCIREFRVREGDAAAAFQMLVAAEQVSMQYDGDFSAGRIERERELIEERVAEYDAARALVQASLSSRIAKVRGGLVAVPAPEDDGRAPSNPLLGVAYAVGRNVPRFTPPAMRREAGRRLAEKKRRYRESSSAASPVAPIADARMGDLERMDFMYNRADAMMIDGGTIRFLKSIEGDERGAGGEAAD